MNTYPIQIKTQGKQDMNKNKKAPEHLRDDTKKWWEQVATDYELEPHHLRLLTLAAEAWDRCQQAREAIEKHGLTFNDRFEQPRPRPEAMKEAWEHLRERIMEVWKVEFAGTRPYAWWQFEAVEYRQRVDGKPHPFDNPEREDMQLYIGKPRMMIGKDDFMAEYEGELEYLLRLGLVEADEVKRFTEKSQYFRDVPKARCTLLATLQATDVVT
jgi:hypothetical protein